MAINPNRYWDFKAAKLSLSWKRNNDFVRTDIKADGTIVGDLPDGSQVRILRDGTHMVYSPDGNDVESLDGSTGQLTVSHNQGESFEIYRTDGSMEFHRKDGSVIYVDPDGTVEYDPPLPGDGDETNVYKPHDLLKTPPDPDGAGGSNSDGTGSGGSLAPPGKDFDDAQDDDDPPPLRDPLILDLNGDGIKTISASAGAFFDHDGDGFAEQTGWVDANDGLLVMDRNGDGVINDGKELFGDHTVLSNGRTAANGFAALADLDSNHDGKIDANDEAFSQLRVWRDADGDGYFHCLGSFT